MENLECCPHCDPDGSYGEADITSHWQSGRLLRKYCRNCHHYIGEPYVPEQISKEENIVGKYFPAGCGGWRYTTYDQYGHIAVLSQSYSTEEECTEEARKDAISHSVINGYGQCYSVVWPPLIEFEGKLVE